MLRGAPRAGNVWGDVLAFVMTVAYAAMLVVLRKHREVTMISAAWLSALLGAAVTLPLAAPTAVGARDLLYLALFGTSQMGLGFLVLTVGSRLIPATENALIGTLDTPLSPLWVWLAFGRCRRRRRSSAGPLSSLRSSAKSSPRAAASRSREPPEMTGRIVAHGRRRS